MSNDPDTVTGEEALRDALEAATAVELTLNDRWADAGEQTRVSLEFATGAEDQPIFIFTLQLPLPDDFDADDWPTDEVAKFRHQVGAEVVGSPVDDWDWLVTARAATPVE